LPRSSINIVVGRSSGDHAGSVRPARRWL